MAGGALEGVRVLDLATERWEMAGRILADLALNDCPSPHSCQSSSRLAPDIPGRPNLATAHLRHLPDGVALTA